MRAGSAGFTLLEMLVALAIMALIAALVPPAISGGQARRELRAAARDVASLLQEARTRAIARNRPQSFAADVDRNEIGIGDLSNPTRLPKAIRMALHTAREQQLGAAAGAIRFFPDGSATGGGITLSRDGRRYDVLVDWLTGRIATSITDEATGR